MTLLDVRGVSKSFGGTLAVDGVSLSIAAGRVHALVGENGAGKSTLLRIVGGVIRPDQGELSLDGKLLTLDGPADAQAHGIQIVHQELALLPQLTVAENLLLGAAPTNRFGLLRRRQMTRTASTALERLGRHLEPDRRVDGLSTADQQIVEIGRALTREVRVLVLDEPTAALGPGDTGRLLGLLRELAGSGIAVVYVSHRLSEVLSVADEVSVLKDGRRVTHAVPVAELTVDRIVKLMVGRDMADLFPRRPTTELATEVVCSVEHLVLPPLVRDVTLQVRKGEIVGIYGLDGHGQNELLGCIGGRLSPTAGTVRVGDRAARLGEPRRLAAAGIGYVPPDRKLEGLLLAASSINNISLPVLRSRLSRLTVIDRYEERALAREAADAAGVRGDLALPTSNLSGGNQQKVLLARLLATGARLLALDQPTRGVDVGAKAEIYRLIREICAQGAGALVVSQEIAELIGLCDRILVMRRGSLTGEIAATAADEETVLKMAV